MIIGRYFLMPPEAQIPPCHETRCVAFLQSVGVLGAPTRGNAIAVRALFEAMAAGGTLNPRSAMYRVLYMAMEDAAAAAQLELAQQVVAQFDRMASREGGRVTLASLEGSTLRVLHRAGSDPDCDEDSCVLPAGEIRQMMAEVLERRGSHLRVEVISDPVTDPLG
jgi:hypothetical protein